MSDTNTNADASGSVLRTETEAPVFFHCERGLAIGPILYSS